MPFCCVIMARDGVDGVSLNPTACCVLFLTCTVRASFASEAAVLHLSAGDIPSIPPVSYFDPWEPYDDM